MELKNSLYALAIAGASSASSAYAQSYSVLFSNLNGTSAAFTDISPNATQVKLDFTLNATGAVDKNNLVNWSVSLVDSSSTVLWTDNVVVGGVIQTLGGLSRTALGSDIVFNFNTGTQVLGTFDTMTLGGYLANRSSGGTVYNVYSSGTGTLSIFRSRQNASIDTPQFFTVTAGGAVTPVPEASVSVAGLGLAMAGLYQLRRRRQNTVTE